MKRAHHGKTIRTDIGISLDACTWHVWIGRLSLMWVRRHYVRTRLDGTHSTE